MATQAETTEQSEEQWEEEDEDFFLKSLQTTPGQNNNQISKLHYARGPKTEAVKKNPLVLMVAEKPSIALSITEALSRGKYTKGFGSKSLPVYQFSGIFKGYQANFKVTSVAGHVFNRDFP